MLGGILTWLVTSRLGRLVAGVWGVIMILGLAVLKGMSIQKAKEHQKKTKEKAETLERIQNVKVSTDRDASLARLRKRGSVRDDDTL